MLIVGRLVVDVIPNKCNELDRLCVKAIECELASCSAKGYRVTKFNSLYSAKAVDDRNR